MGGPESAAASARPSATIASNPSLAAALLDHVGAPPRLRTHLEMVHEAACRLCAGVEARFPSVRLDRDAVAFGAATHDIGKVIHASELESAGSAHAAAGEALLLAHGVPPDLARFARTHGEPDLAPGAIEDWVVMVADAVWKGARWPEAETGLRDALVAATGDVPWAVFLALDEVLDGIAADADARVALHAASAMRPV